MCITNAYYECIVIYNIINSSGDAELSSRNENEEKGVTRTLTVRNVPIDIDIELTEQAKTAGKSKSDFVREFLTASFGDLIRNFMQSSGLVALMDRDLAHMMNAGLADYWFDGAQTLAENRVWCRLLCIRSEDDLQRIMRDGVPLLEIRAKQLSELTHISHGTSLLFALFAEVATRELPVMLAVHRELFFLQRVEDFLDAIDEIRAARRLPPVERGEC